jgi:hypothetical protein
MNIVSLVFFFAKGTISKTIDSTIKLIRSSKKIKLTSFEKIK